MSLLGVFIIMLICYALSVIALIFIKAIDVNVKIFMSITIFFILALILFLVHTTDSPTISCSAKIFISLLLGGFITVTAYKYFESQELNRTGAVVTDVAYVPLDDDE